MSKEPTKFISQTWSPARMSKFDVVQLEGFEQILPRELTELSRLYHKSYLNFENLESILKKNEGFVALEDNLATGEFYEWYWLARFANNGGELAVLFPFMNEKEYLVETFKKGNIKEGYIVSTITGIVNGFKSL